MVTGASVVHGTTRNITAFCAAPLGTSDGTMSGGMSGIERADLITRHYTGMAVVLATDYSEQLAHLDGDIGVKVLAKSYRVGALGRALGRSEQPV